MRSSWGGPVEPPEPWPDPSVVADGAPRGAPVSPPEAWSDPEWNRWRSRRAVVGRRAVPARDHAVAAEGRPAARSWTLPVASCPACGTNHLALRFRRLAAPVDHDGHPWVYQARCPNRGGQVLAKLNPWWLLVFPDLEAPTGGFIAVGFAARARGNHVWHGFSGQGSSWRLLVVVACVVLGLLALLLLSPL